MRPRLYLLGLSAVLASVLACSASNKGNTFGAGGDDDDGDDTSSNGSGQGAGNATSLSTADSGGFNPTTVDSTSTGSGSSCATPFDVDDDGDGFTENDGDCNDCDANVNPGAIEVVITDPDESGQVPEPADEDCDGQVDNLADTCDAALAVDDFSATSGAKAVDLCQFVTDPADRRWGVLEAKYVRANGSGSPNNLQVGIFDSFGPNVNVQGGDRMFAVSSGYSRRPGDPNACGSYSCTTVGPGSAPGGFPQDVPGCFGDSEINDDVGLEVKLRAPTNATGFAFLFDFYSFEYPEWVCTSFNDQFIALVTPPPAGSINGNVSFDSQGNPVSVNIAFFEVCSGCSLGTMELQGNGFDGSWAQDAGATSWLKTQAPITGGQEFTIRFATWDTGDTAWDSTTLIDGFEWIASGGTVAVGTQPVEDPK